MSSYRERLWVPVRWWLLALLFAGAVWLAYQHAYGPRVSVPAGLLTFALAAGVLVGYGRAKVAVEPNGLLAGRARLPLWAVGAVEVLDADTARRTRGPDADPRAYLLLRSYVPGAVRVVVNDPADPVPYWYVSTRQPEQLATALRSAVQSTQTEQ
ncbi:MAG TPA: DUF3093 domain-containing protein [Jiangellaceae bacterium]|nr:DUF3093 domain-containing protein [Jiangellaceae bacterium]